MLRIHSLFVTCALVAGFFFLNQTAIMNLSAPLNQDREALWKQVKKEIDQDLPKSAIATLKKIYSSATAEQAWGDAARAISQQYFLEGRINQPAYPYAIKQMQAFLPDSPEPIRPILKVILANWLNSYLQQNRWRFSDRSQTATQPSEDIQTWDLPRLLGQVDEYYTQALSNAAFLQSIPIADYSDLLEITKKDARFRPTLYDFVAFEALNFYAAEEQITRPQNAFIIRSDSPIFSSTSEFLRWVPDTEDDDAFPLRAVQIFQNLLRFHQNDPDQSAFLDADLLRLQFGRKLAEGSESVARYQAALQRFADKHVSVPLSSMALANLAQSFRGVNDLVKAMEIAAQGQARFPESRGGKTCQNIINTIELSTLVVSAEQVWNGEQVTVDVRYRNIDQVHFRLVEFDFANWSEWGEYRSPQNITRNDNLKILTQRPAAAWSKELAPTEDYQERSVSLPVDVDLKSGFYLLICSNRADFSKASEGFNEISIAEVWVSNLAVVTSRSPASREISCQVFDAISGQPLKGVDVSKAIWKRKQSKPQPAEAQQVEAQQARTNEDGMVSFPHNNDLTKLDFSYQDQKFGFIDNLYSGNPRRQRPSNRTVFFTDRSLYRPGQTIQFKGICIHSDTETNDYSTLVGKSVTVTLYDANNEAVEKKVFRSNEFGSFSGSFTAPRNRLTGFMRLQASGINGSTRIQVEEYKRPKFFVEMEQPKEAFQLGQQVSITGKAAAYTGAPSDRSKVTWRVTRGLRYPAWYTRRYGYVPQNNSHQEIADGTMETDAEGNFTIQFTASADESVARKSNPTFQFTVYADVTDSSGETRSAQQTTRVGYTSLQADLQAADWQTSEDPIDLTVKVTTLDGKGQEASGNLVVNALLAPEKIQPAKLNSLIYGGRPAASPENILSNWVQGETVLTTALSTTASGEIKTQLALAAGAYMAVFETTDPAGQKVRTELPLIVHDPTSSQFPVKLPNYFVPKSASVEPGDDFIAFWGTGYETGSAFVEIEHRGKVVKSYWTPATENQHTIKLPIEDQHRGGLQLRITYVRENRMYATNQAINVPWTNKKLAITWEHFVSKLQPGGRETWTAVVKGIDADQAIAEMVAGMYDASLDAFLGHNWISAFNVFYKNYSQDGRIFRNVENRLLPIFRHQLNNVKVIPINYPRFRPGLGLVTSFQNWYRSAANNWDDVSMGRELQPAMASAMAEDDFGGGGGMGGRSAGLSAPARKSRSLGQQEGYLGEAIEGANERTNGGANVDLDQVSPRKNLQETAFFFPHLQVAKDGSVRIEFEIPEALTKWKFLGFAHDNALRAALLTSEATTSKDLMVQPNPPRFLRVGDVLEFSVKVTNQSEETQIGKVKFTLADARTGESVDASFGNKQAEQTFEIPAQQSTSLHWKITVPNFVGTLVYKAVGGTETITDGEEGFLPVLSNRILVTESLPLPIRGNETKEIEFQRLLDAAKSDSLQSQNLTVQMTSNPSWYAVMALPYLMEFPHQCSEQVFNRLYANYVGQHIVNSDPKIKQVFEQWRGTDALDSPLEKNEDLRNIILAESPWLLTAKDESQSRRNVSNLLDVNRMNSEIRRALEQLVEMQRSDGAWPWFPGGLANDFITLYVTTGFGRLRRMGADIDVTPALNALVRLDEWMEGRYQDLKKRDQLKQNNLSPTLCLYFYGRSFFLRDKPLADKYQEAFKYFEGQAKQHWAKLNNRQSQGHLAIALKRMGDQETPQSILKSLTERSLQSDELGMYWQEESLSWWWYRAPIETQALMIEAYDEVAGDANKVEELKIWLLKQKQTQNWKTTKATADACYALLLNGSNLLASNELVAISLGNMLVTPENVEAGTGFYEKVIVSNDIQPEMGNIKMTKSDEGIAWGSIHWQYLEDISKITPYTGTPLTIKKRLYVKQNTAEGPVISEITGPLQVGDEIVTRVELRVDRDMEFIHLKDYRASGTEPVNVISRYKFQDGLGYYESTRDTASHFFIDYLPRGTHVFEYSVRIQNRGVYESGIAEIQSMYAPEFNSHSESVELTVK